MKNKEEVKEEATSDQTNGDWGSITRQWHTSRFRLQLNSCSVNAENKEIKRILKTLVRRRRVTQLPGSVPSENRLGTQGLGECQKATEVFPGNGKTLAKTGRCVDWFVFFNILFTH